MNFNIIKRNHDDTETKKQKKTFIIYCHRYYQKIYYYYLYNRIINTFNFLNFSSFLKLLVAKCHFFLDDGHKLLITGLEDMNSMCIIFKSFYCRVNFCKKNSLYCFESLFRDSYISSDIAQSVKLIYYLDLRHELIFYANSVTSLTKKILNLLY